jgi:hypothetical protein
MADTPERIYAWVYHDGDRMHHNWSGDATYGALQTEYVRADLATPLTDPRVTALVEAAEGVEGRFYQAAQTFHNTQFWSDEEHEYRGDVLMSEDKVGYLVVTDVVEQEDGGATYSFDLDKKTEKLVAELGLKLILICGAYDLDIEDALEAVHDKGKEQSV